MTIFISQKERPSVQLVKAACSCPFQCQILHIESLNPLTWCQHGFSRISAKTCCMEHICTQACVGKACRKFRDAWDNNTWKLALPLHLSLLAIEGGKNAATPFDATLQHMPQDGNPRATIRHLDFEIEGFLNQKDPG